MSKNIGLINFHYSDSNYGAVLQAAALADIIGGLGYLAEHINYIPDEIEKKITLRQRVVYALEFLGVKKMLKRLLRKKDYIKPIVVGKEVFEQFRNDWIARSVRTYTNVAQLDMIGDKYSIVIVGSDQVWRPNMFVNKNQDVNAYFLLFLPDSVTRVSYAASFGVDYWEEGNNIELTRRVRAAMAKFKAVSVREKSGLAICRDNFSIEAKHVLDPTLLSGAEFFEKVIASAGVKKQNNNLVYYKLDVDSEFISEVNKIGRYYQVEVEDIYYKLDQVQGEYRYIPVAEWIAKIRDGRFIVTDSFHCVCLSILFNKEFICVSNKMRGLARIQSLLDSLGIEGRLCDESLCLSDFSSSCKPIDYSLVNSRLNELREESKLFLTNAIVNN